MTRLQVIRYDVGGYAVLRTIHEFEHYLSQNEDPQIRRRGQIRTALRALDRQIVVWPYTHVQVGLHSMTYTLSLTPCSSSAQGHG